MDQICLFDPAITQGQFEGAKLFPMMAHTFGKEQFLGDDHSQ
jgi:hypothetical protein